MSSMTVADLASRYMETHVAVNCNAHTQMIYRGVLRNHLLPQLGSMPIDSVGPSEVAALHYMLRDWPVAANRTLMVLSKMFNLAEAWGFAPINSNPCRQIPRYRVRVRERFLTEEEYRRIGRELRWLKAKGDCAARAAEALRLLMLTGCRMREILTLRWDDVDRKAGELRLSVSKTGARMVPLPAPAAAVLDAVVRVSSSPWVFTGNSPDRHLSQLTPYWYRVRERADLNDVRIHDLRHSFASRALALGESLSTIGRLLGHADMGSTTRYAHLEQDAERVAIAKLGASIGHDLSRRRSNRTSPRGISV